MSFEIKEPKSYKDIAQITEIDTSSPEKTLKALSEKYDFIYKAEKGMFYTFVNEKTDYILIFSPHTHRKSDSFPVFRPQGDKIICVNYPEYHPPRSPAEFVEYIESVNKRYIDTSDPEETLTDADRKYDFVEKVRENPSAERLIALGAKPDDILVKDPNVEGEPPAGDSPVFRASGDKIICINHPDLYKPMTPREFVDYLEKVESKIHLHSSKEKVGNTRKELDTRAEFIFKKTST